MHVRRHHRVGADHQGVAVGRGAGDRGGADIAAGAGPVLQHERLAERGLHPILDRADDRIAGAAGGLGRDDGDGLARIVLRRRRRGENRGKSSRAMSLRIGSSFAASPRREAAGPQLITNSVSGAGFRARAFGAPRNDGGDT